MDCHGVSIDTNLVLVELSIALVQETFEQQEMLVICH